MAIQVLDSNDVDEISGASDVYPIPVSSLPGSDSLFDFDLGAIVSPTFPPPEPSLLDRLRQLALGEHPAPTPTSSWDPQQELDLLS